MANAVPTMKISYIGQTGAGKTVAIVGGTMAMGEVFGGGFTLSALNPAFRSWCRHAWDNLHGHGDFPDGTFGNKAYVYPFALRRNNQQVMPVDIIDYRGGIIDLAEAETYDPLISHSTACSSINVVLDADDALDFLEDRRSPAQIGLLARGALDDIFDRRGDLPPVCIQITKADKLIKIGNDPDARMDWLIAYAQACLPELFAEKRTTTVVPTSVYEAGEPGRVAPWNMEIPFIFGFHQYLKVNHSELLKESGALRSAATQLTSSLQERKKKWWGARMTSFFRARRQTVELRQATTQLTATNASKDWIGSSMTLIDEHLADWPLWDDGKRVR